VGSGHRQASTYGGLGIVAIRGPVVVRIASSTVRAKERAGTALNESPPCIRDQELPVGLERALQRGGELLGNGAAQEATILLVQIRLLQGQSQQAIEQLKAFARKADAVYRARPTGYWCRLRQRGHPKEAAEAYEQAAAAAQMDFSGRSSCRTPGGLGWLPGTRRRRSPLSGHRQQVRFAGNGRRSQGTPGGAVPGRVEGSGKVGARKSSPRLFT